MLRFWCCWSFANESLFWKNACRKTKRWFWHIYYLSFRPTKPETFPFVMESRCWYYNKILIFSDIYWLRNWMLNQQWTQRHNRRNVAGALSLFELESGILEKEYFLRDYLRLVLKLHVDCPYFPYSMDSLICFGSFFLCTYYQKNQLILLLFLTAVLGKFYGYSST